MSETPKISVTVTDSAKKKVLEVLEAEGRQGQGLRVMARGEPGGGVQWGLNFVEDEGQPDDVVVPAEGFRIHLDPGSANLLDGGTIDFLDTLQGSGFKIESPGSAPPETPKPTGPTAEKIQSLIDEVINPGVASHGGVVTLIDVKDDNVYLQLGGGCQGCGMVDVTLKQGIEVLIREKVPGIKAVYDVTDHAGGKNPYYRPSK